MDRYYWQLPDRRVWDGLEGRWMEPGETMDGALSLVPDLAALRDRIRLYGLPLGSLAEIEDLSPGPDHDLVDGRWVRKRFTKKDFLLWCGLPNIIKLNTAIAGGNMLAKTVHDLLFAAEYIDVADPDTVQMVGALTSAEAGGLFEAAEAARILAGKPYVAEG